MLPYIVWACIPTVKEQGPVRGRRDLWLLHGTEKETRQKGPGLLQLPCQLGASLGRNRYYHHVLHMLPDIFQAPQAGGGEACEQKDTLTVYMSLLFPFPLFQQPKNWLFQMMWLQVGHSMEESYMGELVSFSGLQESKKCTLLCEVARISGFICHCIKPEPNLTSHTPHPVTSLEVSCTLSQACYSLLLKHTHTHY